MPRTNWTLILRLEWLLRAAITARTLPSRRPSFKAKTTTFSFPRKATLYFWFALWFLHEGKRVIFCWHFFFLLFFQKDGLMRWASWSAWMTRTLLASWELWRRRATGPSSRNGSTATTWEPQWSRFFEKVLFFFGKLNFFLGFSILRELLLILPVRRDSKWPKVKIRRFVCFVFIFFCFQVWLICTPTTSCIWIYRPETWSTTPPTLRSSCATTAFAPSSSPALPRWRYEEVFMF